MKKNNRELAFALNNSKACCHVLTQRINILNAENLDLRTEVCKSDHNSYSKRNNLIGELLSILPPF